MSVKFPPKSLQAVNYETLKKGSRIHRVHLTAFAGNSFNPCGGGQTRFAPLTDSKGRCVPSLYTGSDLESAIFETIFHDVPAKAKLKTVRKQKISIRTHSELKALRSIKLVKLYAPDLMSWGIKRQRLIASSPALYGMTAKWAEAIHHEFPKAEGLVWTSNQCDPEKAYLFFGDRVGQADFAITTARDGKTDSSFLGDVRAAGRRSGILITL